MSKTAATAATLVQPVIWTVLGYQFEAASMIAGLSACLMVRIWVSVHDKSPRAWLVDLPVMLLALLFTAGWIVEQRPQPFYALMTGTAFGALGAGIITIALKWLRKFDVLGNDGSGSGPTPPDMAHAIRRIDEPPALPPAG